MKHIFIVNAYAGNKESVKIREFLANRQDLDYFVFDSRSAGDETEIVKKIHKFFGDSKLRIYCCGGSGTFRNALCGIEDMDNTELAFYSCGLTNDFLKVFGEEGRKFSDIEELIHGESVDLDYIWTNYGLAINTLSMGIDSTMAINFERFRGLSVFGDKMPYLVSSLFSVFFSQNVEYDLWFDNMHKRGFYSEVCYGNGNVFGGGIKISKEADPTDGKGQILMISKHSIFRKVSVLNGLKKEDQSKIEGDLERKECRHIRIRRCDGKPFEVNYDGELVRQITDLEARIVRKGLKFVVPQGVRPMAVLR